MRYLWLTLSSKISKRVDVVLPRKHRQNPQAKFDDYVASMLQRCRFTDRFAILNTAGDIEMEADFRRRTVCLSMQVDPPGDKKRPTAAVNWLTRQPKSKGGQGCPDHLPLATEDAVDDQTVRTRA